MAHPYPEQKSLRHLFSSHLSRLAATSCADQVRHEVARNRMRTVIGLPLQSVSGFGLTLTVLPSTLPKRTITNVFSGPYHPIFPSDSHRMLHADNHSATACPHEVRGLTVIVEISTLFSSVLIAVAPDKVPILVGRLDRISCSSAEHACSRRMKKQQRAKLRNT